MATPFEWRIDAIERKAAAAAPAHEVAALHEHVARLERALGEIRAECDGLRARVEAAEAQVTEWHKQDSSNG